MTGKGIEVAIERRHVDSAVHDPLTTVDEYRHALAVRRIDARAQVGPRPEHVRRLRNAYDARAGIDQFVEPAGFERSGIVERKHSQLRPLALAPDVKTISRVEPAPMNRRTASRAASYSSVQVSLM